MDESSTGVNIVFVHVNGWSADLLFGAVNDVAILLLRCVT
jgi:hypothetical protein